MRHGTGYHNSAFGHASLHFNTSASWNSAFGTYSLYGSTGQNNTGVGARSLMWMNSGNNNVAIGYMAGDRKSDLTNLVSSNNGIYIGAYSRANGENESNSIVIGYNAVGEGSNTTVIGTNQTSRTRLFGETDVASLKVSGSTVLKGQVIIEQAQGDISMGIYQ